MPFAIRRKAGLETSGPAIYMRIKAIYLIISILLIALLVTPLLQRFTITDRKSGSIVFQDNVEKYKDFYISFTHSVNKTPVNEYYSISEDKLILEKASFSSYGAGMPEAGEYGSGAPSIVDGMVQINNIHKVFKNFTYISGTYANHSLNIDDNKIFFSKLVKPQTPVTFEVKRISIITIMRSYWIKNKIND